MNRSTLSKLMLTSLVIAGTSLIVRADMAPGAAATTTPAATQEAHPKKAVKRHKKAMKEEKKAEAPKPVTTPAQEPKL